MPSLNVRKSFQLVILAAALILTLGGNACFHLARSGFAPAPVPASGPVPESASPEVATPAPAPTPEPLREPTYGQPIEREAFGIRPNHVSAAQKIATVKSYFSYWKNAYIKTLAGPRGGYYVAMQGVGPDGEKSITTSEAHGYGMIIFALMADHEPNAKQYFDGLFNVFDKHRSSMNSANMAWIVTDPDKGSYSSATDGDMDIAYALLLAHARWGSGGAINYLAEAKRTIQEGIKKSDFNSSGRTSLGDWDKDPYNTRSSDWMPGHFRAYYAATQDEFWLSAAAKVYQLVQIIQSNYSPLTGLMPDFVIGASPRPAPANYLDEGTVDFSWNACRNPLRLAIDYGLYGTAEAKTALMKMSDWIVQSTGGDPAKIRAGYFLDGKPQANYSAAAFIAPLVAAATADQKYQSFVNRGWDTLIKMKSDYYSDSINLLALLYLSDLWR